MTTRNEIQAIQSVKDYTVRKARRLYYGTLGNNAGTVDTARNDWVYLRLHGDGNQVVEAYAAVSFPRVANVVVDVEKVDRKGGSYYQVLGVSAGITYTSTDNPFPGLPGEHATTHQRRDRNTGGYDPLDVYNRALVNLRARAQTVPDLTVYVERGFYVITSFKEFVGGNSPAFTVPTSGWTVMQRWDLLYLGNDDALHILQGTAAYTNPVYPTVPANCIPIAYVILASSDTVITEAMITDARTILSSNQATATAHNLLSAVHSDTLTDTVVDGDVIIGNVTPAWSRLAISVPAAGTRNMLGVDNGELRPSWKADSIYSLVSGVRPFTGTVGGVTPVASTDLATKGYVDLAVSSLRLDEFFASTASDIGGIYYVMDENPAGAGTVVSAIISSNTTTNIFNFATLSGEPHLDRLVAGVYDVHAHLLKTGNRTITCYAELYKRVGGVETLLGTSSTTPALTAVDVFYDLYLTIATEIPLNLTDRLVLKWYAVSANPAGDTTVTMTVGGTADPHLAIIVDPVELHTIFVPYTGSIHDVTLGTHTLTAAQMIDTGLTVSTVIYSDASKQITSLANGAGYLTNNGAGALSWSATATATAHNLLSAIHGDTTVASVVRGDIITGQGASPKWTRLAKGNQYSILTMGANEPAWSGFLLDGTTGGKTVFAVTSTKTLTLTNTNGFNLTLVDGADHGGMTLTVGDGFAPNMTLSCTAFTVTSSGAGSCGLAYIVAGTTLTVPTGGTAALLAVANSFTAAQTITVADATVGIKVAGATGKFRITGYQSATYGGIMDVVNAAENAYIPFTIYGSPVFIPVSGLNVGGTTDPGSGIVATNGVKFPATQVASADANTLDDYEENTFDPALSFTSGSVTYTVKQGAYTKIGRLVVCNVYIVINTISSPSGDMSFQVPFTSNASAGTAGAIYLINFTSSAVTAPQCYLPSNSTTVYCRRFSAGAQVTDLGSYIQAGSYLLVSISYTV